MSTLTIDGKEITVEEGTTILKAAEKLGIFIPHYCYHPSLSVVGSCRLCFVEVAGSPKLVASCSTSVQDGMEVVTNSERIIKSRESIMEFLLINHPLDCPVCDRAGECNLQDYAFLYGKPHSRFKEEKKVFPRKDFGEHVVLYTNRCIMCTRCVRVLKEIAGHEELGVFQRGEETQIDVFPEKTLKNKLAGNIVDICPVGALIDKDFLHKTRVWNLTSFNSICPKCSKGCNIRLDVKDNTIFRIKPRQNDDVNSYWICDDGRYGYHEWDNVKRVESPLKNDSERHIEIGWDEAIYLINKGFKSIFEKYGSPAIAGLGNSQASNEENFLLHYYIQGLYGSGNIFLYHINQNGYEEGFKCGFKIESDKNPNKKGAVITLGIEDKEGSFEFLLEKIDNGEIKTLYFIHKNIDDKLDDDKLRILQKLEFFAVQSVTESVFTEIADVVLPGTNFSESDGTYVNSSGRIQRYFKAIEQHGLVKEGWEILYILIKKSGGDLDVQSPGDVFNKMANNYKEFNGLTFYKLGDTGVKLG
ncbi:molybdopterin-dependent oxidoreductase [candidate division KSB1 bacterium]